MGGAVPDLSSRTAWRERLGGWKMMTDEMGAASARRGRPLITNVTTSPASDGSRQLILIRSTRSADPETRDAIELARRTAARPHLAPPGETEDTLRDLAVAPRRRSRPGRSRADASHTNSSARGNRREAAPSRPLGFTARTRRKSARGRVEAGAAEAAIEVCDEGGRRQVEGGSTCSSLLLSGARSLRVIVRCGNAHGRDS